MIDWVCAITSVAAAATRRRMRYCGSVDYLALHLSAFDDAVMGHFVDHLSRAECVKTCTRHNDRLGLRHQQRGRQRRQDGVCVTVGALTT